MKGRTVSTAALLVLTLVLGGCSAPAQPEVPSEQSQPPAAEAPAAGQETEAKIGPFAGMQAPDFTLTDMDGTEWTLSALKGNSVALIFFTSW